MYDTLKLLKKMKEIFKNRFSALDPPRPSPRFPQELQELGMTLASTQQTLGRTKKALKDRQAALDSQRAALQGESDRDLARLREKQLLPQEVALAAVQEEIHALRAEHEAMRNELFPPPAPSGPEREPAEVRPLGSLCVLLDLMFFGLDHEGLRLSDFLLT